MKIKIQIITLATLLLTGTVQAQWNTNGNTLTGTLPSSPNEWIGSSNGGDFIIKTNSAEKMRILSGGNVGIGTTIPAFKLNVQASSGVNPIICATNSDFINGSAGSGIYMSTGGTSGNTYSQIQAFTTGNSAVGSLSLNPFSGNVGIGTTTPGALLEVAGQVKITGGSPGAGKVLTSDANGLATWTTLASSGAWTITGNSGTVDGTNFIGTTDDVPLNFRVNNEKAGRIDRTDFNTFFGYQAGNSNTTGQGNVFTGFSSGKANTSGFSNTGSGFQSLYSNTTGYDNSAHGSEALKSNTTGTSNTAIGSKALLWNDIGIGNTASGREALTSNTSGNDNTADGLQALQNNTTGSSNTATGEHALRNNTTGSSNTALGYQAGKDGTTHSQCTFIGAASTLTTARTNATLLGYGIVNAQCTGNNQVCVGNTAIAAGGLRAAVTGWTAYSDARFKTNVKENVSGMDFIMKLRPVTYNVTPRELHKIWGTPDSVVNKMDFSETEKETRIGFIAQEVEKAAKESGFNFPGIDVPRNDKEVYTLRYVDFIMPMIKGMQEQQTIIDKQEKENNKLKEHLAQQDSAIATLKKQMEQLLSLATGSTVASIPATPVELSDKNAIVLDQNVPNPFMEQTLISYFIPDNVKHAQIVFSDQSGKLIKTVELQQKGKGSLNIYANDLSNGVYSYSIIADGQIIETKKMVKTK